MQEKTSIFANRWIQLLLGVICMMTVANLQYGWPAFVKPIAGKFNWHAPAIDVSVTIFILLQTWLVPIEGWFIDRYGSRLLIVIGGVLAGLGWVLNSFTSSLQMLYLAAVVCGVGAGCIYGATVANALKWFPTRRGLAVGLTAGSYGAGSALTVGPIADYIKSNSFEQTFLTFGLAQGAIIVIAGLLFVKPPESILRQAPQLHGATLYNARPMEVLREPVFWLMYLMMTFMIAAGLMATAQFAQIARDGGHQKLEQIIILGFVIAVPAMTIISNFGNRVVNGMTRPFFGWISDMIGRENTMFIAFMLEAVFIVLIVMFGPGDPAAFVVLALLIFLCWGELYALFPATSADSFGARHAGTNYGMLYTAKGMANLLLPFGPMVISAFGNWSALLYMTAGMSAIAALMALFVLKPMRLNLQKKFDALHAAGKGQ